MKEDLQELRRQGYEYALVRPYPAGEDEDSVHYLAVVPFRTLAGAQYCLNASFRKEDGAVIVGMEEALFLAADPEFLLLQADEVVFPFFVKVRR